MHDIRRAVKEETTTTTRVDVYTAGAGVAIDSNFVGDLLRGKHDAKNDAIESYRLDLGVNSRKMNAFLQPYAKGNVDRRSSARVTTDHQRLATSNEIGR